jgi:uncharacterized protein YecT (DUF1311 family)
MANTRPLIGPLGMLTPPNWLVISAATGTGPAYADPKKPLSAFTEILISGLRGAADRTSTGNGDGKLTAEELVSFLRIRIGAMVRSATGGKQRPSFHGRASEFLIAVPIAPASTAPPPAPSPAPPTTQQKQGSVKPSFNCARAATTTEKAICADPAIAALDNVMAGLYRKANAARRGSARNALVAQQKQWLRQRNNCGSSIACLARVYAERIGQLQ